MLKKYVKKEFLIFIYNLLKLVCLRIYFFVFWLCVNSGEFERFFVVAYY